LIIYFACTLWQFSSLRGSSVRGTAATEFFKHCRYSVRFTHHQIEFHCLLIEKEDNFAELLPGAYAFELSATEQPAAAPPHQNDVNPSVDHDFDLAAAFALLDVPPADITDFPATQPIPPENEQQRYDLTYNERLSMSNSDPLGAEEETGHDEQRCTETCAPHCGTSLQPRHLVSGAHSDVHLSRASLRKAGPGHPFLHPRCGAATLACLPVTRGTRRHLLLRLTTRELRVPPLGRHRVARTARATFSVENSSSCPMTGAARWRKSTRSTLPWTHGILLLRTTTNKQRVQHPGRHRVTGTVRVPSTTDCSLSRPMNGVPCWRNWTRFTLPWTRGTQRVPLRAATYSGRHRVTGTVKVPSTADCSLSRPMNGVPCWRNWTRSTLPWTRGTQRAPLRAATYSDRRRYTRTVRVPSTADCFSSRPMNGVPCWRNWEQGFLTPWLGTCGCTRPNSSAAW
jgi:hypothetical protein